MGRHLQLCHQRLGADRDGQHIGDTKVARLFHIAAAGAFLEFENRQHGIEHGLVAPRRHQERPFRSLVHSLVVEDSMEMFQAQQFQGAAGFLDMNDLADAGDVHDRTQQLQGMGLGAHQQHTMSREIRPFHESAPQEAKICAFSF